MDALDFPPTLSQRTCILCIPNKPVPLKCLGNGATRWLTQFYSTFNLDVFQNVISKADLLIDLKIALLLLRIILYCH